MMKWNITNMNQDIIIYGHDHTGMICHSQNKWFINSGLPDCPANDRNIAKTAILEIAENNHISVRSIEIKYGAGKVVEHTD